MNECVSEMGHVWSYAERRGFDPWLMACVACGEETVSQTTWPPSIRPDDVLLPPPDDRLGWKGMGL